MTAADESDSLISALNRARIPLANHDFIRQIVDGVGIDSYRANVDTSKPHVIATRSDGGRDLGIYYGYTVGFPSEEEIVRILGPAAAGRIQHDQECAPRGHSRTTPASAVSSRNAAANSARV